MTDEQYAAIQALRERLATLETMADSYGTMDLLIRQGAGRQPPEPPEPPQDERQRALMEAAAAAGFSDPHDARRLLYDREGEADELVAELAASKPYLLAPDINAALRAAAGKLPPPAPPEPEGPQLPTGSADGGSMGDATAPAPDMTRVLRRAYHRQRFGFDDPHWNGE
jgi:hypothetical protein